MRFKEWLRLDEIPHAFFPMPVTVMLPNEKREPMRVTFDLVDMRLELYVKGEPFKTANLQGFNAKFPFANSHLVCYGTNFDSRLFKTHIGEADERLTMLSPDWYRYAQFVQGNTLVYWAMKGIYEPTNMAVTA